MFCSCFTVACYFLMSFPFMVVIRVCFPSRTNFPLKVSRYTSRCCVNFYLHYQHIIYSRKHRHPRFAVVGLFSGVTFRASCNMFMSIQRTERSFILPLQRSRLPFYQTNRFHVALGLFSNRSQMMSKCSKNKTK